MNIDDTSRASRNAPEHPDRAGDPILSVSALTVTFGIDRDRNTAVDTAAWELHRGEVLAIVGESGSGKSATALAVAGLLPAGAVATGSILFDGRNLLEIGEKAMRSVRGRRIAMIFQDPLNALDPVFSIGSQMIELLRVYDPELGRAAARDRALQLLQSVRMPDPERKLGQYPHQLSGGQCQRVMVAMALASAPDVLLADEPTTALDVTVQQSVLDLLRDVADSTDTAVVLITHDMGVVADIADRVVVMHASRVVETAPVRQLFAEPHEQYTRDLLAAVPRREAGSAPEPVPEAEETMLAVSDLVVEYGGGRLRRTPVVSAVDGVSFTVGAGEIVGLVGESGSGKSTIGKAVVGLAPITAGTVQVGNLRIDGATRSDLRAARRQIGVVFQNPTASLDPRRTIGDAIGEPLAVIAGLRGAPLEKRVGDLMESVELPRNWSGRYPHELSGGQRQRVGIARALSLQPRLVIADEPTSALDVSVQATVLRLLARLQSELGFACLFISHDLAVVGQLCHRVAVLKSGRIVEQGDTEKVLGDPDSDFARALLDAAPIPDPLVQSRLRAQRRASTRAPSLSVREPIDSTSHAVANGTSNESGLHR
ncbi:ABC transporter ATP-binding protein [Microbacterium sp. A8/3-1]|uniref:ABC transporter ATP-binding protein n=1 Tax=Microbacterium sp. A8/3-1 TaxID=3160749 RepID=A0AAU7VX70_9MICO